MLMGPITFIHRLVISPIELSMDYQYRDIYRWTKENSLIFLMHYKEMPDESKSFKC